MNRLVQGIGKLPTKTTKEKGAGSVGRKHVGGALWPQLQGSHCTHPRALCVGRRQHCGEKPGEHWDAGNAGSHMVTLSADYLPAQPKASCLLAQGSQGQGIQGVRPEHSRTWSMVGGWKCYPSLTQTVTSSHSGTRAG